MMGSAMLMAMLAAPTAARAQDQDGSTQQASGTEPDYHVDTIVVTATRRAQSLQDVGLSITAIGGEELAARGATDIESFAPSIPNLGFGATNDGVLANRSISIRGIEGLNTTGFYIDDVPLDPSVSPLVLDVERIEVLRGPQGTLYGARGLGGTVRMITKQPEFDGLSGKAHARISTVKEGDLNLSADGAINVPVGEQAAVRLSGYYDRQSGIFDRVVGPIASPGIAAASGSGLTGGSAIVRKNVDDKTTFGGMAALRIRPAADLDITARLMAQKTKLDGYPLADFAFDPDSETSPTVLKADDFTQNRLFDIAEGGTDRWVQASLGISYDAGFGTVSSSTGYFNRRTQETEDSSEFISFTLLGPILQSAGLPTEPAAVQSPIHQRLDFRTFVQELRFVSDFKGPLQLTAGLFYQDTDSREAFTPDNIAPGFDEIFSTQLNGGVAASGFTGFGDLIFRSDSRFKVKEFGAYGEASIKPVDRLTLTVGARYFDVKTRFTDFQEGFAVGSSVSVGPLRSKEHGVNLKFLAEFKASEDVNLYASAAEGFRIGGANSELPSGLGCPAQAQALGINPDDATTFQSDSLWSYEAGVKSTLGGGVATVNAAAFYIDFSNIQQRVLLECGFDFVANIGAARSKGFELETALHPVRGLTLGVNLGYTDSRFSETVPGLVTKGDRIQQVPQWTASANADYRFALDSDWEMFVRGDLAYVGSSISRVVDAANPRTRPSYTLLNTRLGLSRDRYTVTLFVDNLTNEDAVFGDNRTLAAEAYGRPRIVRNRPRTIGLDLALEF